MAEPAMELTDILELLPHRYPILLVDRILEIEPGARVVALKQRRVPSEERLKNMLESKHQFPFRWRQSHHCPSCVDFGNCAMDARCPSRLNKRVGSPRICDGS